MNKSDFWTSADGKRMFHWDSVVGFDFKPESSTGFKSVLYLYLTSGIFHLNGREADDVFLEMSKKKKK